MTTAESQMEMETMKKQDLEHDEFADANVAQAELNRDAGMWSEWQNLGVIDTLKTFRFTCLLCMMAAFSAATDEYQVNGSYRQISMMQGDALIHYEYRSESTGTSSRIAGSSSNSAPSLRRTGLRPWPRPSYRGGIRASMSVKSSPCWPFLRM